MGTLDKVVGIKECADNASWWHGGGGHWMRASSNTCVVAIRNGRTLSIGQYVTVNRAGLMAPNARTSMDERTDGAACSRVR
jgi:N6-adenosine-specific RNA methylase IME4